MGVYLPLSWEGYSAPEERADDTVQGVARTAESPIAWVGDDKG